MNGERGKRKGKRKGRNGNEKVEQEIGKRREGKGESRRMGRGT